MFASASHAKDKSPFYRKDLLYSTYMYMYVPVYTFYHLKFSIYDIIVVFLYISQSYDGIYSVMGSVSPASVNCLLTSITSYSLHGFQ